MKEERRGDGRGKTGEEILAWYVIPLCRRQKKKPHEAGNVSSLPAFV